MMKKWINFSELCSRWNINEHNLTEIVLDGKLGAYDGNDFSSIWIRDDGVLKESREGYTIWERKEPLTVEEVINFIFRISDVESYEKKNGITPQVLTNTTPPQVIVSTASKEASSQSEEIADRFIRSLHVSLVKDNQVKIKAGNERSRIFEQKELGFKKPDSKIWKDLVGILEKPDHTYHVGKARGAKRARKESYDILQKRLSGINDKLVPFFNRNYQIQLPNKFKVYELIPEKREAPGTYRFKFPIVDASQGAKEDYENLSREELMRIIETRSSKLGELSARGDEDSEEEIMKIQDELNLAIKVAADKEWIGRNQAAGFLNPKRYISHNGHVVKRKKRTDLVNEIEGYGDQED